ncbi:MAG: glycosyltransferase family 4 protein [Ilumatobacteraceae bacterium]
MLVVTLVTRGSPMQVTGGHLYHRRMAEAAPSKRASIEFVDAAGPRNPMRGARGVVLVDSLTAWSVAPWTLATRRRGGPLAAILHQPPGGVGQGRFRTALQRPLDLALYRRCALLITASDALARQLVDAWDLPAERISVVEPGCDVPIDVPIDRSRIDDLRRGRRIAVLSVGNWLPNKGVLELVEAVAALPSDHVTLHLAGRTDADPRYGARVYARLRDPGLSSRVVVHGPVDRGEVGRLYGAADAFALASYAETYGTVFGEALFAGLPVVGWRSGNLPHLIDDGREGCLVTPGDVAGLSRALCRLATDAEWRAALHGAAARRGAQLPTWDDSADAFFGALGALDPLRRRE